MHCTSLGKSKSLISSLPFYFGGACTVFFCGGGGGGGVQLYELEECLALKQQAEHAKSERLKVRRSEVFNLNARGHSD